MTKLNWRDASKELPTPFSDCLLIHDDGYVFTGYYNDAFNGWDSTDSISHQSPVTHWLPLNELPLPEGVL